MDEEVRRGWWDGRLFAEFRGALEALPEDETALARAVADAEASATRGGNS
jgi:hypothetical protein